MVARFGGEEFAIVLPNTDAAGAEMVVQKIQTRLQKLRIPHTSSSTPGYVTVSMGVTTQIPETGSSTDSLLQLADQLLYQAKQQGRNTYRIKVLDETPKP